MESWTRLQQLEQVLLLELLRDSGGLPEWAAEPGRVPFISGSAVQAILKTKVTTAQWLLHGEEEPLFRKVGSGPRGVRVEQAPSVQVLAKKAGNFSLRASIVTAGDSQGRNRHASFLEHVQFALDASAVLHTLLAGCSCEEQRLALLLDALVPVLHVPQVGLRNAHDELAELRRRNERLKAQMQRSALRAEVEALKEVWEEYAKQLLNWEEGAEVPAVPDVVFNKGGLVYKVLRSFMPLKDQSARRARRAEREAGEPAEEGEAVKICDRLWDELTPAQRLTAEGLGWSEDMWDNDDWSGVPAMAWGALPPESQQAAEALDLDEMAWEEGVGRAEAGRPQPPCEKHWDELEPAQQRLVGHLGFSPTAWVDNDWSDVTTDWSNLSAQHRRYAEALGFQESSWGAATASSVGSMLSGARDQMVADDEDPGEEGASDDFATAPALGGGTKTFGRKLLLMLFPISWLARIGSEREMSNFTFLLTIITWFFTRGRITRYLQFGRGICLLSDAKQIKPFLRERYEKVRAAIAAGPKELVTGYCLILAWLDNYQKWLNLSDERVSRHGEAQKHGQYPGSKEVVTYFACRTSPHFALHVTHPTSQIVSSFGLQRIVNKSLIINY